jgi:ketosteroid isomerase-like protein
MPDHPNAALVARFYAAFAALDATAMAACYAADARFDDPVFSLAGRAQVGAMWAMLCEATRANGPAQWRLQARGIAADDRRGQAHWDAWYRFGATGRDVHNAIDAAFEFRDGLIATHRDAFDFWAWSRQALGAPGLLLGWTPMLRAKVRAQAAHKLAAYRESAHAGSEVA